MPHLASFYRHYLHKALDSFSLQDIKAKLGYPWLKRSKGSSGNNADNFDRVGSDPDNDMYLETRILGSVQGKGKFLDSQVHPQREWVEKGRGYVSD